MTSCIQSHILNTPLEIYQAAQIHFSGIESSILRNQNHIPVTLVLKLQNRQLVLKIESSIDPVIFSEEMKALAQRIKIDKILKETNPTPQEMNVTRFSLQRPLSDWQTFVEFLRKSFDCSGEILTYLRNQSNHPRLSEAGLAPEQIGSIDFENDLVYFKKLTLKLEQDQKSEIKALFAKLIEFYPTITKKILDERATASLLPPERNKYQEILDQLKKSIFGQAAAIELLASELRGQLNRTTNGTYLFAGPTGVGKTELAKAVSTLKSDRFVSFSMCQYSAEMYISSFFGSSAGLVGSEDLPHFGKAFNKYIIKPTEEEKSTDERTYIVKNMVILFDEFEKAHSDVKQSLLNLFDEGYCDINYSEKNDTGFFSSSKNVKIRYLFEKSIFIATSNLYQHEIMASFTQGVDIEDIAEYFVTLNYEMPTPKSLSQELLSRMTIIPFDRIPPGECYQGLLKAKLIPALKEFKDTLECRAIQIENREQLFTHLEEKLYGEGINIRKLKKYFKKIETAIYKNLHKWPDLGSKKLTLYIEDNQLKIKVAQYLDLIGDYHETGSSAIMP